MDPRDILEALFRHDAQIKHALLRHVLDVDDVVLENCERQRMKMRIATPEGAPCPSPRSASIAVIPPRILEGRLQILDFRDDPDRSTSCTCTTCTPAARSPAAPRATAATRTSRGAAASADRRRMHWEPVRSGGPRLQKGHEGARPRTAGDLRTCRRTCLLLDTSRAIRCRPRMERHDERGDSVVAATSSTNARGSTFAPSSAIWT